MHQVHQVQDVGRGAGLRLWMFAQSLGQLSQAFGRDRYEGVVDACRVRCFMQPESSVAKLIAPALCEVRNLFNEKAVVGGDTTVLTNFNDPSLAAFNPFTDTPVEGVNWVKGPLFGQPTNATNWINAGGGGGSFQLPRTYLFAAGLRF